MSTRYTRGLRVRTRCTTVDELVDWFHPFCDETSIYIATPAPRAEGTDTVFSIDLANDDAALVGEGVVLATFATRDNRFGQPGMQIGVRRLTRTSVRVFEQILIARAVAADARKEHTPSQLAEEWDEGTQVDAPSFAEVAGVGVAQPVATPTGSAAVADRAPRVETAPITKQTLIGIPSIPAPNAAADVAADVAAPPPLASAMPATGQGVRTPPARLSPNAFSISVPARIPQRAPEPAGSPPSAKVASTASPSPAKVASSAPVPPTNVASTAPVPSVKTASTARLSSIKTPRAMPAVASPQPVAPANAAAPTKSTTLGMPALSSKSAASSQPASSGKPTNLGMHALSSKSASSSQAASSAVAGEVPVAVEIEPASARVPRAATVLGSGPVPRQPASALLTDVDEPGIAAARGDDVQPGAACSGVEPAGAVAPAVDVSIGAVPVVDVSFDAAVPAMDVSAASAAAAPSTAAVAPAAAAAEAPQERSTWPLLAWSTDQRPAARRGRHSFVIAAVALACVVAGGAVLWSSLSSQPVANSAAPVAADPTETNDQAVPTTAPFEQAVEPAPAATESPTVATDPATPAVKEEPVADESSDATDAASAGTESASAGTESASAGTESASAETSEATTEAVKPATKRASVKRGKRGTGKRVAASTHGSSKRVSATKRSGAKPRHKGSRRKVRRATCNGLDCL